MSSADISVDIMKSFITSLQLSLSIGYTILSYVISSLILSLAFHGLNNVATKPQRGRKFFRFKKYKQNIGTKNTAHITPVSLIRNLAGGKAYSAFSWLDSFYLHILGPD